MKYFRMPIDNYYQAVTHEKRPKYAGAFKQYTAVYNGTVAYVKGEIKEEYYEHLLKKDGVSEFSQEDYVEALKRC